MFKSPVHFTIHFEDVVAIAVLFMCFNALFIFNFYINAALVGFNDLGASEGTLLVILLLTSSIMESWS
jgi:hypothetical protein